LLPAIWSKNSGVIGAKNLYCLAIAISVPLENYFHRRLIVDFCRFIGRKLRLSSCHAGTHDKELFVVGRSRRNGHAEHAIGAIRTASAAGRFQSSAHPSHPASGRHAMADDLSNEFKGILAVGGPLSPFSANVVPGRCYRAVIS
jgi:hypothetical protein